MSNNYQQIGTYETNLYNNQYNSSPLYPIYKEPIKRKTIYENVKVKKAIVLPGGDINSYLKNIENYDYNNNFDYSEYPVSNNNETNNKDTYNNYFGQTTIELPTENNYGNYFNSVYSNKIENIQYNEYSSTNNYLNNNFAKTQKIESYNNPFSTNVQNINYQEYTNILPEKFEFAQIQKIPEDKDEKENIKEKEIAQVRKITEDNTKNIEIKKEENEYKTPNAANNLNKIEIKNLPGPAKISKISNATYPLNPRVRFAKEEKKINIIQLTENNNKENKENNNNIYINNKVEIPEIKKEEIELKNETVEKNENNIINNKEMDNQPKKENIRKGPNDDYDSSSRDRKFHKVKIIKKKPTDDFFAQNNLLNIGDYNYLNYDKTNPKPKINIVILNHNKNQPQKKPEQQFQYCEYNTKNELTNKFNNKKYEDNDNNTNSDCHSSDIIDNNEEFELNNEEVKDTDEIYNNIRIKEDSNLKRIQNNDDGLDEFDNNFNEHDKFYKKMKNLFDD